MTAEDETEDDDEDGMAKLNRLFAETNEGNETTEAVDEDSSQAGWKVELNGEGGYIINAYDGRDRDPR